MRNIIDFNFNNKKIVEGKEKKNTAGTAIKCNIKR